MFFKYNDNSKSFKCSYPFSIRNVKFENFNMSKRNNYILYSDELSVKIDSRDIKFYHKQHLLIEE